MDFGTSNNNNIGSKDRALYFRLCKNNYIKGIGLGIAVYIMSLFIFDSIREDLWTSFSYTGMGSVDKVFGFFFGFFKGYVFLCVFFLS